MALAALQVYKREIGSGCPEIRKGIAPEDLDPGNLHEVCSVDESISLNFTKVELKNVSMGADAKAGNPASITYDLGLASIM